MLFTKFIAVSQIKFRDSFGSDVNDLRVRRNSKIKYKIFFLIEVVLDVAVNYVESLQPLGTFLRSTKWNASPV